MSLGIELKAKFFLQYSSGSEMKRPAFTKSVDFWQGKTPTTFTFLFSYILDKIYLIFIVA